MRPVKLRETELDQLAAEFREVLSRTKMFDGKISFTKEYKYENAEKAQVVFTPLAYIKMFNLIDKFDSEVGWHCVVRRDSERESRFIISDILVYPQYVTGTTVNTDQARYTTWLMCHDDEVFNAIRGHGHSHVRMGVTPSGVDTTHWEGILSQMGDDDFYVFQIWNKNGAHTIKVYDLKNNVLYEDGDVEVSIGDNGIDMESFVSDARELVQKKTYTYTKPTTTPVQTYNNQSKAKNQTVDSKPKPKNLGVVSSNNSIGKNLASYDPEDDGYGSYAGYGAYGGYSGV